MQNIIHEGTMQEATDMALAKEVGDLLYKHYPQYLWAIETPDHCVVIRLLDAPIQGLCMFLNRKDMDDPARWRKMVVMLGGEFLERCGVSRSKNSHDLITAVDGADYRHYTDVAAKAEAIRKQLGK